MHDYLCFVDISGWFEGLVGSPYHYPTDLSSLLTIWRIPLVARRFGHVTIRVPGSSRASGGGHIWHSVERPCECDALIAY